MTNSRPASQSLLDRFRQTPDAVQVLAGVGAAEFVSSVVAIGVLAVDDIILKQHVKPLKNFIANRIILPRLETIENFADTIFVNKEADIEKRKLQTREERANNMADTLLSNGFATGISVPVAVATQAAFDKYVAGSTRSLKHHTLSRVIDGTVHIGVAGTMHSLARKQTRNFADGLQNVLQKVGVGEKQAHDVANYLVRLQFPGLVGNFARVATLLVSGKQGKGH